MQGLNQKPINHQANSSLTQKLNISLKIKETEKLEKAGMGMPPARHLSPIPFAHNQVLSLMTLLANLVNWVKLNHVPAEV